MKIYRKSEITSISLDKKQAILQTCQNGGAYFVTSVASRCFSTGMGPACPADIKGASASMGFSYVTNAQSS